MKISENKRVHLIQMSYNRISIKQTENDMTHIYEIYTKNPETGEKGWDIKWVNASEDRIRSFPNFDCVITIDDFPMAGDQKLINWM